MNINTFQVRLVGTTRQLCT